MKVLIPMEITNCESDCPFWEENGDRIRLCVYDWGLMCIPDKGIHIDCPLKKFEVTKI